MRRSPVPFVLMIALVMAFTGAPQASEIQSDQLKAENARGRPSVPPDHTLTVAMKKGIALARSGDFKGALALLGAPAMEGHAPAQNVIGVMYYLGDLLPRDPLEGIQWWVLAANQGSPVAMRNIADAFVDGGAMKRNLTKAREWYGLAAKSGEAHSQAVLSEMLAGGDGGPTDYKAAYHWARKSAEQGDSYGQRMLGIMYGNGWGVTANDEEALHWLMQARKLGDTEAALILAEFSMNMVPAPAHARRPTQQTQQAPAKPQRISLEDFVRGTKGMSADELYRFLSMATPEQTQQAPAKPQRMSLEDFVRGTKGMSADELYRFLSMREAPMATPGSSFPDPISRKDEVEGDGLSYDSHALDRRQAGDWFNKHSFSGVRQEPNFAVVPRTGELLLPAGPNMIRPRDGQVYLPIEGGFIDPRTGEFAPAQ